MTIMKLSPKWTIAAYGIIVSTGMTISGLLWYDRTTQWVAPRDWYHEFAGALERALVTQCTSPTTGISTNWTPEWTAVTNQFRRYNTDGTSYLTNYWIPSPGHTITLTNYYKSWAGRVALPFTSEAFGWAYPDRWIWNAWTNLTFSGFPSHPTADGLYTYSLKRKIDYDVTDVFWLQSGVTNVGGEAYVWTNVNGWMLVDYGPWASSANIQPNSSVIIDPNSPAQPHFKTFNGDSPAFGPWFLGNANNRQASSTCNVSVARSGFSKSIFRDAPCMLYVNRLNDQMSSVATPFAAVSHFPSAAMLSVTRSTLSNCTKGVTSRYIDDTLTYTGFTNFNSFVGLSTSITWSVITNRAGVGDAWDNTHFLSTNALAQVHKIAFQLKKVRYGVTSGGQWISTVNVAGNGESSVSWAAAKAIAVTNIFITSSGYPMISSAGAYRKSSLGSETWQAFWDSSVSVLQWSGCTTQIEHDIEFFVRSQTPQHVYDTSDDVISSIVYDDNGEALVEDGYSLYDTHTNTRTNNFQLVGSTNIGSWCSDPKPASPSDDITYWNILGYEVWGFWTNAQHQKANAEIIMTPHFQFCTNNVP